MAIAIFDVGKTNVKLSLVEAGAIRETLSAPNRVLPGPPFPHYDEAGIWSFLMQGLARLGAVAPITDIVAVAHGGGCGLVDAAGALVLPMLDYEMPIEDDDYDRVASPFSETFSPPLGGLNIARQLHWFQKAFPAEFRRARHLLLYPQYWSFRLSGVASSELTYLGCHTGLWQPVAGRVSGLVERMGWQRLFPPLRKADDVLGPILPAIAAETGLPGDCRVRVGIHDSSASFLRHRLTRPMPFAVASTGTWVVTMAAGADVAGLPENRSCLVNVDALGSPVPCGLFLGGREYAQLTEGASSAAATPGDIAAVIRERRHAGAAGRELRRPFCRPALGRAARAAAGLGRRDRRPGEPLSGADDRLLLRFDQGQGAGHRRRQPDRQRDLPGRARHAAPAGDGAGLQ